MLKIPEYLCDIHKLFGILYTKTYSFPRRLGSREPFCSPSYPQVDSGFNLLLEGKTNEASSPGYILAPPDSIQSAAVCAGSQASQTGSESTLAFGLWLGLTNGEHWQEMRESRRMQ